MNIKNIIFYALTLFGLYGTALSNIDHRSSYPLIAGDTFRAYADVVLDQDTSFNPSKVKAGAVIFVQIDLLHRFFTHYHPNIKNPYILLTHRCAGEKEDDPLPGEHIQWLDDPKIIAWFSQNIDRIGHPKLRHLPIGISNHCWPQGHVPTFNAAIKNNAHARHSKLLYMNFSIDTYPQERKLVYNLFKDSSFCTIKNQVPLKEYLEDLQDHKFVLSPRGNGLDCHRTWECLLIPGTIPIVMSSTLDPLFENLPVLVIDDWTIITEDFLNQKYQEMMCKEYASEKALAGYWLEQIDACRKKFLDSY